MSTSKISMAHFFAGFVVSILSTVHAFPALARAADPDSGQTWSEEDGAAKQDTLAQSLPDVVIATAPVRGNQVEVLPFAENDLPRPSFSVGLGAGVASYLVDLKEVDQAFRAMEDVYRNNGYYIPESRASSLAPMALYTLTMPSRRR
jgi:hypothetical protein